MPGTNREQSNTEGLPFVEGQHINRQRDLHDRFGGTRQSGISPCAKFPFIFLFTAASGKQHGYKDRWLSETTFEITGEGQFGDMEMKRGNRAVLNHVKDGRELHLFKKTSSGAYEYLGQFEYESHTLLAGEDTERKSRQMIQFRLRKL